MEEVNIGGVYIRIFNKLEGAREGTGEIPDCSFFAVHLMKFIGQCMLNSKLMIDPNQISNFLREADHKETITMDEENHWYPITSDRFKMSVEALLNLVKLNGLINDEICGDGGPSVLSAKVNSKGTLGKSIDER